MTSIFEKTDKNFHERFDLQEIAAKTSFKFHNLNIPFINPKEVLPIAVDIGYSSTKLYGIFGQHIFPSLPINVEENKLFSPSPTDILYRDKETGLWFVGDAALSYTEEGEDIQSDEILYNHTRTEGEDYKVLLRVALALGMAQEGFKFAKTPRLKIITGLPHKRLDNDKEKVKEAFSGHHKFELKIGDNDWVEFSFVVNKEDVKVTSQPFGTLFSLAANRKGEIVDIDLITSKNVLIFDGGFFTIDTFYNKVGKEGTSITWNNRAMHKVYEKTVKDINNATGRNIKIYELDKYIKDGCVVKYNGGRIYMFDKDLKENIEAVANTNIRKLTQLYNHFNDIDVVISTGGTGKAFYPYFESKIPVEVRLAEKTGKKNNKEETENFDCVMSNVVGYFNILMMDIRKEIGYTEKIEGEGEIQEEVASTEEKLE